MARPSAARQEADAVARRVRFELGRDIRAARRSIGASLRTAAARAAMSHTQLGRIERGAISNLTVGQLSRACSSVGLRLHVRAVPGGDPALDSGQLALIARLRAKLPPWIRVRTEVPLLLPGDRRAWDLVVDLVPERTPIEAETRLTDVQMLDRRAALKLRDSEFDRLILLVADTPHNRRMLDAHRQALRASFPLDTRAVMASLRAGRTPVAGGVVVL